MEDLRLVSLVLLLDKNKILLAMKKRGFGKELWNGAGGKQDPGETIEETAIRECQEEINITPKKLNKVGIINFYFTNEMSAKGLDQQVHLYICREWDGEPSESEEMKPKWFNIDEIPYETMWKDDKYWLPLVLNGKKIEASFSFNDKDEVVSNKIKEVDNLN